uniref:Uncharacterized protein n=1 Tax=Tanacetum cinerariifolium TaxID=118510 RepID=A0A6L2JR19_TANCI|nr:hypothetical protein [Tanacetum cinerariifolium]
MYYKKNVDFAYLLWEDFVYQVEHKDAKKTNEIYYPRFTKVIIHYFMTKDPSILRRNKVNWHYVRDDQMFTMIKLVSRHQNTQQFGVMFPVELTNEDIRNSEAYKEYYAIASRAAPLKTKASVRKTKSSFNTIITPPSAAGTRLLTSAKGKQPAKASKAKGLTVLSEVAMTEAEHMKLATKKSLQQTHISQACGSGANEGTGIIPGDDDDDQDDDDQDDNDDDQDTDNDGDDFVHPKLSIHEEEAKDEESFDPIVQTPKNSDDEGNNDESLGLNVGGEEGQDAEDDDEELYRDVNINLEGRDSSSVSSQFVTSMLNPSPDADIDSLFEITPWVDVQASTTVDLLNFGSLFGFDHRLKILEANFSEFVQTNQFAGAVSFIPRIVKRYMDQLNEAVKTIKEQVKEQVKVTVSKILPKIKKTMNEQLEAEVMTRSSNSSKTSYAVAADLSEMERKKILIEKIESNKKGKEPESTSAPKEKATKTTGKSTQGSKSHRKHASKSELAEEPMQTTQDLEEPSHQEFETGAADDLPITKASQHPEWFQQQKKPTTPDRAWNKTLPATHESIQPWISDLANGASSRKYSTFVTKIKAADYGHIKWIEDLVPRIMWSQELVGYEKYALWGISHWGRKRQQFYGFAVNRESAQNVELSLSPNFRSLNGMITSIWIGSRYVTASGSKQADKSHGRRTLCFQRLSKNVYKKHRHLTACGRSSTRLMWIDELHKFIDGTLNDVRTALDDRLKGIRMKYLPQAIWRKSDKDRAAAMIQAIDKQLKTRRIM